MPENDNKIVFSVRTPDGRMEQWNQQQYDELSGKLFEKYPEAQVVRTSAFDPQTDDNAPSDMFHVSLPDGRQEEWSRKDFNDLYEPLMAKYPEAQVMKTSDMSTQYWEPKMQEAKRQLDEFNAQHGQFMREYEFNKGLVDSLESEGVMQSGEHDYIAANDAQYQPLSRQREQLRKAYYGNPLVAGQFKANAKAAGDLSEDYSSRADDADTGSERRDWKRAAKLQDDIRKLYDAPNKYIEEVDGSNGFAKFMRDYRAGAGDVLSDKDFWTRGLTEISRNIDLRGIAKKMEEAANASPEGLSEEDVDRILTPGEKAQIMSFYRLAEAQKDRAENLSGGYSAGGSFAESLGFMAEFILSSGLANVAGKALSASSKGFASWLGRELMSERALNRAVEKGLTVATDFSKLNRGAKAARLADEYVAKPLVQGLWHTSTQVGTLATISDGLMDTDSNGQLISVGRSVLNGVMDSIVENWSESFGGAIEKTLALPFEGIGALGRRTLGNTGFGRWARWLYNSAPTQVLKEAGFNGMIGEIGEEWAGNAVRVGLGLMTPEEFKDFASWQQQLEMAASFAPMSLVGLGSSSFAAIRNSQNYNRLAGKVQDILQKQGIDQNEIDNLFNTKFDTPEDIAKKFAPYLRNVSADFESPTAKEDYKTMLDFAKEVGIKTIVEEMDQMDRAEKRNDMREVISGTTGRFWQEFDSPEAKDADGNPLRIQQVRVLEYSDGHPVFIIGGGQDVPGQSEALLATVDETGKKGFIKQSDIDAGIADGTIASDREMMLDDYLQERVDLVHSETEGQRVNDDWLKQVENLKGVIRTNPRINIGTTEAPVEATVMLMTNDGVNIRYTNADGAQVDDFLPWQQVGDYLGMPLTAKSDTEIEMEAGRALDDAQARLKDVQKITPGTEITVRLGDEDVRYPFEKAILDDGQIMVYYLDENGESKQVSEDMVVNLPELTELAKAEVEAGQQSAEEQPQEPEAQSVDDGKLRDFRGNEIPLLKNGEVNRDAFFKNDTEAWARWNDEQNQDGGADSIQTIQAAMANVSADLLKAQAEHDAMPSPGERYAKKQQIEGMNNRLAELQGILDSYTPAQEAAPVEEAAEAPAAEEGQQPASASERIPKDKKGNMQFEQAPVEDTAAALVELASNDLKLAMSTARSMNVQVRSDIKKAEKVKVKGTNPVEIIQNTREKEQKIQNLRDRADYWNSVAENLRSRMEAAAAAAGRNERELNEPQTLEEAVAGYLAGLTPNSLDRADFKRELGWGNSEMQQFFRLWAKAGSGKSLTRVAEDMAADDQTGFVPTDSTGVRDVQAVRNAIISVMNQVNGPGELRNFTRNANLERLSEMEEFYAGQQAVEAAQTEAAIEEAVEEAQPADMDEDMPDFEEAVTSEAEEQVKQSPEAEAVAEQIEAARQEVDKNPTEAQKEAGNYKKGHITLDGYDISIENPKGSIRRGTDASGREWQQEMHNDYGYIRMTEGPDGDHIDVFLSDNPTEGNVFVVDQVRPKTVKTISSDDLRRIYRDMQAKKYVGIGSKRLRELLLEANPDLYGEDQNATEKLIDAAESEKGNAFADAILAAVNEKENGVEFDEHKVMYGFPDAESARAAYLSNYEEGWQGLGVITEVTKDEFKKWIESSHRKTKPFSEYKSVKPEGAQNEGTQASESAQAKETPEERAKRVTDEAIAFATGRTVEEVEAQREAEEQAAETEQPAEAEKAEENEPAAEETATETAQEEESQQEKAEEGQEKSVEERAAELAASIAEKTRQYNELYSAWLTNGSMTATEATENIKKRLELEKEKRDLEKKLVALLEVIPEADRAAMRVGADKAMLDVLDKVDAKNAQRKIKSKISQAIQRFQKVVKTKAKALGKLNVYSYVSNDEMRPVMNGVFHDKGYAVASDLTILIADKASYDKKNEGKIIGKKGEKIDGKYPKWRLIIPENGKKMKVNFSELRDFLAGVKAQREAEWEKAKAENPKTGPKKDYLDNAVIILNLGEDTVIAFKYGRLSKFADYAERIGAKEIEMTDERRAVLVKGKTGLALLMPIQIDMERSSSSEADIDEFAKDRTEIYGWYSWGTNEVQKRAAAESKPARQQRTTDEAVGFVTGRSAEEVAAERETEKQKALVKRIAKWKKMLGNAFEVITDINDVTNEKVRQAIEQEDAAVAAGEPRDKHKISGWFDPQTKKSYVYLPHVEDQTDLDRTILHEVIAHKGIRGLYPTEEQYNKFLDWVYKNIMSAEARTAMLEYVGADTNVPGGIPMESVRAAADEFIAHVAEKNTSILKDLDDSVWNRIVEAVKRIIEDMMGQDIWNGEQGQTIFDSVLRDSFQEFVQANRRAQATAKAEPKQKSARTSGSRSSKKIEDFGEKIGGARKDLVRSKVHDTAKLSSSDLKMLGSTDKILSAANVIKSFHKGEMDEQTARTFLALAQVAKRKLYGSSLVLLTKYRDLALAWANGQEVKMEITDKDIDVYASQYNERVTSQPGFRDRVKQDLEYMINGSFYHYMHTYELMNFPAVDRKLGSFVIRVPREDRKDERGDNRIWVKSSWDAMRGYVFKTEQDAVNWLDNNCPAIVPKEASGESKEGEEKAKYGHLDVVKDQYGWYRVKSRITPGNIFLSKKFGKKEDADKYLEENHVELEERERKLINSLLGSNIGGVDREGPDHRGGRDISEEEFQRTFGTRGVEFGNWVPQGERQLYLNKTYDAIMDLAEILGISPKAFTHGGRLALAFGARGKSRALAHYEPMREVINLTRMSGAGSLAHEWWHSFDNYMSRIPTGSALAFATVTRKTERDEVAEAFKELTIAVARMDYARRSRNADGAKPYWSQMEEMTARLFESYVYNKFDALGRRSPLLVRKDTLFGEQDDEINASAWPYPSKEENENIKPYFDRLFAALQEREDEKGNVVLFRRSGTLIGVHNLSDEKLRKAVKTGGLANPSAAVIDILTRTHENFGEISLLMPSSLVDSNTGRNGGIYTGDAWSPTYPPTRKIKSEDGEALYESDLRQLPDELARQVKMYYYEYLENDRMGNALYWWFLHDTNREPAVKRIGMDIPARAVDAMMPYVDTSFEDIIADRAALETVTALFKSMADEEEYTKATKRMEPREGAAALVKRNIARRNEEIDKYGVSLSSLRNFVNVLKSQLDRRGEIDVQDTFWQAAETVNKQDLSSEFNDWLEGLEDRYEIETKLYDGIDENGPRLFDDTVENASMLMNQEQDVNTYSNGGLSATKSALLKRLTTLSEIRRNRSLLTEEIDDERWTAVEDQLFSIISQLADMQRITDNRFMDLDLSENRLQEALVTRNPVSYLNREYGYNIPVDGEFAESIKSFMDAARALPVKFFEVKFQRPVMLNEFAAAVIPTDLSKASREALEAAGLPLFEYGDDVTRSDATLRAADTEGVRFRKTGDIFISNAELAVENIRQEKATPEQWLKMIEKGGGLKAGEDKWIGLSDWLKASDRKTLTKQEILDFIDQNKIQVEEVSYTSDFKERESAYSDALAEVLGKPVGEAIYGRYHNEYGEYELSIGGPLKDVNATRKMLAQKYGISENDVETEAWKKVSDIPVPNGIPQVRLNYTTHGLTNKREIALTVPTIESWREHDMTHFGDAGGGRAIAWIRFGETREENGVGEAPLEVRYKGQMPEDEAKRKAIEGILLNWNDQESVMRNIDHEDQFGSARSMFENAINDNLYSMSEENKALAKKVLAEIRELSADDFYAEYERGGKILFIDEIQSNRHQEGRERGYSDNNLLKRYNEALEAYDEYTRQAEDKYGLDDDGKLPLDKISAEEKAEAKRLLDELKKAKKEYLEAYGYLAQHVPAAPFEKNWHELAMKRMLRYAAENGYDVVAWTTGDQQNERYSLETRLSKIDVHPANNGSRIVNAFLRGDPDGDYKNMSVDPEGNITQGDYAGHKLADVLGKEMAVRLMSATESQTFEGGDLKLGGEGMRGFYDGILPRFIDKYGKRWGVSTKDRLVSLSDGTLIEAHTVEVTPEMKASVMQGQPMFRRTAPNGKPSNLTEEQWRQVRTPEFKRWFGDWEIAAMETPIHKSKGTFKSFEDATDWARKNLQGKHFTNRFTGEDISISRRSISEMLTAKQAAKVSEELHKAALMSVPDFIETGIPAETHPDSHGRGFDIMRLYNAIELDGEVYRVKSTVKKLKEGDRYYTYELQEMEIIEGTQNESAVGLDGKPVPSSMTSITGAKLLNGVKKTNSDEEILDYSRVVDENGEPRVVYHGTKWNPLAEKPGKAVFDINKVGENFDFVDIDWNFFFTASEASARGYGNAIPVFLNIRNPEVHTIRERISYEMDEETGHDIVVTAHDAGSEYDEVTKVNKPDGVIYTIRAVDTNEAERKFGEAIKAWEGEHKEELEKEYNALSEQSRDIIKKLDNERRSLYDRLGLAETFFGKDYDEMKERSGFVLDELIDGIVNMGDKYTEDAAKIKELERQFNEVDQKMFRIFQRVGIEGRPEYEEYQGDEVEFDYKQTDMFALDNPNQIKSATDNSGEFSQENPDIRYRKVTDHTKIDELESGPKVRVYRSMQLIDGKLYPPMSARVNGEWREPSDLGVWEESEENPDLADDNGYFKLDKGNKKSLKAAYAPYFHARRSPLNEQFSEAYNRPNLVIVEGEIPESELTSGYTAEKSKKSVGEHDWPSGKVSNALAKKGQDTRKVILSRWFKPVRIVPESEVADKIMTRMKGSKISFPYNVVTPSLRKELARRGARFAGWQGNKPDNWNELIAEMKEENKAASDIRFRKTDDMFFSNAELAVEDIQQGKATPEQWLKMIESKGGLKAGEDKWIGLSDWLKASDKKTITKQEVLDYIQANKIRIEETDYVEAVEAVENKYPFWEFAFEPTEHWDGSPTFFISDIKEAVEIYNSQNPDNEVSLDEDGELSPEDENTVIVWAEKEAFENKVDGDAKAINSTRLQYTTVGLDNKQEIALTVPTVEPWNTSDSIHFGDAGGGRAIAWIRFGETSSDGNKSVLVIDEIQSKRHQDARDLGYQDIARYKKMQRLNELGRKMYDPDGLPKEEYAEYKALQDEVGRVKREYDEVAEEMRAKYGQGVMGQAEYWDEVSAEDKERILKVREALHAQERAERGVMPAPFEKNWHELAMKRMLRFAAENGFDAIAWTSGEQQAARYDIGQAVESIKYYDPGNGWLEKDRSRQFSIHVLNGNSRDIIHGRVFIEGEYKGIVAETWENSWGGKPLSEVVGKGLADQIISAEGPGEITGKGLRLGGEGMKGFYDEILPRFMNKYGKKWGVKVEDISLPNLEPAAQTMHSVPITEEMKRSVMQGQPMFRKSSDVAEIADSDGLAGIVGRQNVSDFYNSLYRGIPEDIREMVVNRLEDNGLDFHKALQAQLSDLAFKGIQNDETGLLRLAGTLLRDYIKKDAPLGDRALEYVFWRIGKGEELTNPVDIAVNTYLKSLAENEASDIRFRRGDLADSLNEQESAAGSAADAARTSFDEQKKALRGDLLTTAKAMAAQKEYDQKTVDAVKKLAQALIKEQNIDTMSRREINRILGIVTTSMGKAPKTVKKYADILVDLIVDHLLRSEAQMLNDLANTKASKVNATGVEVQGKLDIHGQNTLKAYKAGLDMEASNEEDEFDELTIKGRMAALADRLSSPDDAVRSEAEDEYNGLALALEYHENIKASRAEEKSLNDEMKDAANAYRDGDLSRTDYSEFMVDAESALRENRVERIEAYRELRAKMAGVISGSIDAASQFREREKQRIEEIHHLANSDMQGQSASADQKLTRLGHLVNSSVFRFFASPLATFDQMLRMLGRKSVSGEGYLWNKFMRGWIEATESSYLGQKEAKSELDEKVSEVFGKDMRWSDLYDVERKMPTVKVRWWDGGEKKEHELTQGNLLYIYMVNKMADGRMKLRRMGIDESDVKAIVRQMDERFLRLADWLQSEYLVEKRNKYNAVHEQIFGASMAAIDNYFPLKINKRSLNRAEDIGKADDFDALPATTTGSIIKRKRNAQNLDLLNADAFSVVIEHIEQMEQWAAFAGLNKDLNTLLSYKRFRNQMQNMTTVYGAGTTLWSNFKNVARIAGGTYHPSVKRESLDSAAVNLAKGVTSAKISFRVYTALKQFLSFPAFLADANVKYLGENLASPQKAWNWAMENLPVFEKRWKSRIAGDTRLMNTDSDWKLFRSRIYDKLSKMGMSPNAFVDAVTIAIGSHAMYQSKYDRYIAEGYSEAVADKKAKQDATVLYNETQQSNENAFVSSVQLDRTVLSTMISVFRNSPMGFQRQLHDALRNLSRITKSGYKEESIEFMAKQMVREGLSEEQAAKAAERRYNREKWHSAARVATFGFAVQFAWNLGSSLAYLLFGDDDDEKQAMLSEAFVHALIGGSIEGLAGGNIISEALNMVAKGESLRNYDPSLLPIISDMKRIYQMMDYDPVAGANEMVNLAVQAGVGVNPQTLTDAVVAVVDACEGDMETSREAMLLIMRVLQVPQSQLDKIYIDELGTDARGARRMTYREMAERYAHYKIERGAPLTGWAYSDELEKKREKAYLKRFKNMVNERKDSKKK